MIKPQWLRKPNVSFSDTRAVRGLLRDSYLNTVCKEARCPNMGECYSSGVATFMILGDGCTRDCGFCAVERIKSREVDNDEPDRVARAAARLGLSHVVITSVTRDDLKDGGAAHFAKTIAAVRDVLPDATMEVLTPDFKGDENAIGVVIEARPDVFNHNVETVPRLYKTVRPSAVYERSLRLLQLVKERGAPIKTKSGIMLGLGESVEEVEEVMRDLRGAGCDILTIGQYLRPSKQRLPVVEYIRPETFDDLARKGREMGFTAVSSSPFTRSSYHAAEVFRQA